MLPLLSFVYLFINLFIYLFIYFPSLGEWLAISSFIISSIHASIIKFCKIVYSRHSGNRTPKIMSLARTGGGSKHPWSFIYLAGMGFLK